MKDQNPVPNGESQLEKYNRAVDLYIESIHKPDNQLRSCAHNQKCFNELMKVRQSVLEYVYTLRKTPPPPPIEPTYNEDGSTSYEYAANITLADISKFQRGSSL